MHTVYKITNMYNMKIGGQGGFSKEGQGGFSKEGLGGFSKENAKKGYIAANWSKTLLSENGKKTY